MPFKLNPLTGELDIVTSSSGSDSYSSSWTQLATQWTAEPVEQSYTGGDGQVFLYTFGSTTYYRFVPSTYDSTQDVFYTTFADPTLSGLVATRGNTI